MARNLQFQVLRGTQGALPSDLAMGEMYFATDTGNLFLGTPGYGRGNVQVGDTTGVNETLKQILLTLEATRRAMVALACQGNARTQISTRP